jgi:hypothetical protein
VTPLRTLSQSFYKQLTQQPIVFQRKQSRSRDKMPLYEALLGEDLLGGSFYKQPYLYNGA